MNFRTKYEYKLYQLIYWILICYSVYFHIIYFDRLFRKLKIFREGDWLTHETTSLFINMWGILYEYVQDMGMFVALLLS